VKIDPNKQTNLVPGAITPKSNPTAAEVANQTGDIPFTVKLSSLVKQAVQETDQEEKIRRDKIAAIRDQLAAGSYKISGKEVADNILKTLQ
jgi:flagellar biosynthesis anti-sigma factor FlgM